MHHLQDLRQEFLLRDTCQEKTLEPHILEYELPGAVSVAVLFLVAGEVDVVETEVFGGEFRVPAVGILVC